MISCSVQDDGEECDCAACREQDDAFGSDRVGYHACTYVGVDDYDECEICGRRLDQFAGLPDEMQPSWDGTAEP